MKKDTEIGRGINRKNDDAGSGAAWVFAAGESSLCLEESSVIPYVISKLGERETVTKRKNEAREPGSV